MTDPTVQCSYYPKLHAPQLSSWLQALPPQDTTWAYGTAGFRADAERLPPVAQRVGIAAALRSLATECKPIGVMVTASHNPVRDNGFKIVDPDGGMLAMDWEHTAVDIVNTAPQNLLHCFEQHLGDVWSTFYQSEFKQQAEQQEKQECTTFSMNTTTDLTHTPFSLDHLQQQHRPVVIIGYDTRPSSITLTKIIVNAALECGAIVLDYGLITTPQLHWFVGAMNQAYYSSSEPEEQQQQLINALYHHKIITNTINKRQCFTHTDYITHFAEAFIELFAQFSQQEQEQPQQQPQQQHVFVDVAYGVGYYPFAALNTYLHTHHPQQLPQLPTITPVLTPTADTFVNDKAGIDYLIKNMGKNLRQELDELLKAQQLQHQQQVQQQQTSPTTSLLFGVDGDCDRLGGFFAQPSGGGGGGDNSEPIQLGIIDGDKLAVLFVQFLFSSVFAQFTAHTSSNNDATITTTTTTTTTTKSTPITPFEPTVSLIQTAYCNGASCTFVEKTFLSQQQQQQQQDEVNQQKQKQPITLHKTCTGVKHLLAQANVYDISVYFEPNGHGAIKFNILPHLSAMAPCSPEHPVDPRYTTLCLLYRLMNPYIGDAFSVLLFTLIAMRAQQHNTLLSVYTSYPNFATRQHEVKVPNKNVIKADPRVAEQRLLAPMALQDDIDHILSDYTQHTPRCFVRPSGTENIVRVFVESSDSAVTDEIITRVAQAVKERAEAAAAAV